MTGTNYGASALWVTTRKLKANHMKHFGDIPHDGTIIPACSGFIYHRMFFENCDAGPIHTDNTEIIAWAIEDGDIFPVMPDGIIREFSSDNLKACVVSPSGRTCVPQVGDYDSFANWERDALEEHTEARTRIKAKAAELVHPCGAVNAATQAAKQERAEAVI